MANETLFLPLVAAGQFRLREDGTVLRRRSGTYTEVMPARSGYVTVSAQIGGRQRTCKAHRLLWTCFRGAIPSGFQIDHLDMCKSNNALSNLEIVTPRENVRRAAAAGVFDGECNGRARLRECDVLEVRRRFQAGESLDRMAGEYGTTREALRLICAGKRWVRTLKRLEAEGQAVAA